MKNPLLPRELAEMRKVTSPGWMTDERWYRLLDMAEAAHALKAERDATKKANVAGTKRLLDHHHKESTRWVADCKRLQARTAKLEAERDELKERCEKLETQLETRTYDFALTSALVLKLEAALSDLIAAAKPHIKGNRLREGREVPSDDLIKAIKDAEKCLS